MIAAAVALALSASAPDACLSYGPDAVTLTGRLEARTAPNSLGGGVVEQVPHYVLVLDAPVCVGVVDRGPLRRETGVRELHVTGGAPDAGLAGKRVEATGALHHRRAGRQFTTVLLHAQAFAAR